MELLAGCIFLHTPTATIDGDVVDDIENFNNRQNVPVAPPPEQTHYAKTNYVQALHPRQQRWQQRAASTSDMCVYGVIYEPNMPAMQTA